MRGEGPKDVCGETSDAWSGPDTTVSLQRLGLPRHLLVPGSREESTTEVEEEEETEREEEKVTLICNPEVLRLKEEVEDSRRRLKECKALIQKLSVDNLRMTGRELSFRTQLEAIATRRRGDSTIMLGKESTKSTLSSKEEPGAPRM